MLNNYECPYCHTHSRLNEATLNTQIFSPKKLSALEDITVGFIQQVCSNDSCGQSSFIIQFERKHPFQGKSTQLFRVPGVATLAPILPIYIPQAIREDFNEAHAIKVLSPKASATLARRCLQTMIRDFWGIHQKNLNAEIQVLKEHIDIETWDAIDSIRKIGNIGAHMEKDINLIIDVDADEAVLILELIKQLIDEWYVVRHEKQERLSRIKAISEEKESARKQTNSQTSPQ